MGEEAKNSAVTFYQIRVTGLIEPGHYLLVLQNKAIKQPGLLFEEHGEWVTVFRKEKLIR